MDELSAMPSDYCSHHLGSLWMGSIRVACSWVSKEGGGGVVSQFRKRPVIIEARQFLNDGSSYELLHWVNQGQHKKGRDFASWLNGCLYVPTLEGVHQANAGDWIICGVKGEFYPCKPDIFEQTYELVES